MTVGIVGAGSMGQALARAIGAKIEPVLLASGRPGARPVEAEVPPHCRPAPLADVWQHTRLVLLALPFTAALDLMSGRAGGLGDGRTLVDVSNPGLCPDSPGPVERSGGELIAEAAHTWSVAKAFNTVPAELLEAHHMNGRPISVPVAGGQPGKSDAFGLAWRLGFAPVDAGDIAASRELESLAMLLIRVSAAHHLHGRVAIHIGQPEPVPAGRVA
jgi:predicted dinucleotide-binding enzyme